MTGLKKFMDWVAHWLEIVFCTTILWGCVLIIRNVNGQMVAVVSGVAAILIVAVGVDRLVERLWEQMRFEYLIYKAVKEPGAEIHEGLAPYEGLNPAGLISMMVMLAIMLACVNRLGASNLIVFMTLGVGIAASLSGIVATLVVYVRLRIWRGRQEDQTVAIRAKMRPMASGPSAPLEYVVKTGRLHEFSFKTKDNLSDWLRR